MTIDEFSARIAAAYDEFIAAIVAGKEKFSADCDAIQEASEGVPEHMVDAILMFHTKRLQEAFE